MTKLDAKTLADVKDAMKNGTPLPEGVKVNFGDPEPFQKIETPSQKPADKKE